MTEHKNLAAALAAFQAEMPTVAKTKRANVGQYTYTYADLADVTEAAAPLLSRHGLAFAGSARHTEGGRYEVVGILSHAAGEIREGALPISGGTPQQLGSSITYMRRYLFGIMTGIVTDNDDDGSLASAQKERKADRKRPAPEEPPAGQQPPAVRTMSRRPANERAPAPISAEQRTKIMAQFGDLKITDRSERLAKVIQIIERDIETSNDLTSAEASKVIGQLDLELIGGP
jgi:hypothetical protein